MKNLLLRSVPFVLSILCGIALFLMSIHGIENDDWSSLVSGISASLLAIPIIFLVYNYADYKMSGKVNRALADNLTFEINAFMLKLIILLRKIMGIKEKLSWKSIEEMVDLEEVQIKKHIKITQEDLEELKSYKMDLDDLVYKAAKTAVLEGDQIQTISAMVNEMSRLIHERKFRGNDKSLANYLEKILTLMDDWFDSCEREALQSHHHFQLLLNPDTAAGPAK
jgi:hypothetical protein